MASTGTQWDPSDTVLMLHMDGADASTTFTDETGKTLTANGTAQIDTAQSVFGGASGLFSSSYLSIPDSADWDFGTGDFTIDFRFRSAIADPNVDYMITLGDIDQTEGMHIRADDTVLRVKILGSIYNFALDFAQDTWYHIAVTRNGTNLRAFADGTQIGVTETNSSDIVSGTVGVTIADGYASGTGAGPMNGWLDELRIVKGTAVWTGNFTAPTAAYTEVGVGGATISRMMLMGAT